MKALVGLILLIPALMFSAEKKAAADSSVMVGDMSLSWHFEGDYIRFRVFAPTRGWVAVGYGAVEKMKGANLWIGWVDGDRVTVEDHFGVSPYSHRSDSSLGGENQILDIRGSETDRGTEIEFTVPLVTGDPYDVPLTRGKSYRLILAYGDKDDLSKHRRRYIREIELN